jgi:hypothetical protein
MIWALKASPIPLSWLASLHVSSNGAVCDQKISKFFVSHMEEVMVKLMGVNGVY